MCVVITLTKLQSCVCFAWATVDLILMATANEGANVVLQRPNTTHSLNALQTDTSCQLLLSRIQKFLLDEVVISYTAFEF